MYSSFIGIYTCIHVHSSYIHVYPLFRKESCKRAYTESQGLVLFGNKVKISPVDRDGKLHVYTSVYHKTYNCYAYVQVHVYMYMYR